jgi:hypothetical protein
MLANQTLTRKQQAFVRYWLENPKASATQAALATYGTNNPVVAASIAYENLRKPQIRAYLEDVGQLMETTIITAVRDWGDSPNSRRREIALDAAKYAHDKIFGKSRQVVQATNNKVEVSIDLSDADA